MLLKKDIDILIIIGKNDSLDFKIKNNMLRYLKSRDVINRLHWKEWKRQTVNTSDEDLIFLFKGLVLVEKELNWIGGSVAGAIWIYKVILERRLDKDSMIADYALKNSNNQWVPFGSSYYGKRTIKDYFAYQKDKARLSKINAEKQEKILKRVTGRKEKRKKSIANLRQLSPKCRDEKRKFFLKQYSSLSTIEKLKVIANDEIYPPEYYPLEWITLSVEQINDLPIKLIKKLYDKLSTKTKGEYKRFAKKLQQIDDGL